MASLTLLQSSGPRRAVDYDRCVRRYVLCFDFMSRYLMTQNHRLHTATGAGKSSILNAILDGNVSLFTHHASSS